MAQNYKTGLIITGDASGGIRAIRATDEQLEKLNQGFDKGSKRSKQFNRDVGNTSQGLNTLRRAAAPIAGVIAGMFAANTLKSQIDFADQLQKTNLRIGASTEALSQYNYVASLSGVQFNVLATAWQRQTRRIAEAANETGPAVDALERLGLSAQNLKDLSPEQQFEQIAAAMQNVASESERVALAQKIWDSEGVKLVQIVNQGTDAIAAMRAEADALGLTISQDTANAMATYNDEVDRLKFAAQGVSQTLLADLIPALTEGMQGVNQFIQEAGGAEVILGRVYDVAQLLAVLMAGRYAGSLATATAAKLAATQQAIAYQAALARMAGASRTATGASMAMAGASRAAAGALALVGGPVGAAVVAAGAIYYFREELELIQPKVTTTEEFVRDLSAGIDTMSEASLNNRLDVLRLDLAETSKQAISTAIALSKLEETEVVYGQGMAADRNAGISQRTAQLEELQNEITATTETIAQAEARRNELIESRKQHTLTTDENTDSTDTNTDSVVSNTKAVNVAADAAKKAAEEAGALTQSYQQLHDRLNPLQAAQRSYATDLQTIVAYGKQAGMTTADIAEQVRLLNDEWVEGRTASSDLADATVTAARDMNREFEGLGATVTSSFIDALMNGEDALDSLKNMAIRTIEDMASGFASNPLRMNVSAGSGVGGMSSTGGMPLLSGMMDGSGAIANAYRAFQGTGSTYAGTFGSELAVQTEGGLRAGFDSFAASGLGNAALGIGGGLAGGYAGTAIGSAVFGKSANSSYGAMGGAALGQTLIPIPGLGAAIGGALGGVVDSLFGSSKKTFDFDFKQGGNYGVFGDRQGALGDFGVTSFSDFKMDQQDELQKLMNSIADFDNVLAAAAIPDRLHAMKESVDGFAYSGPEGLFDARLREIIDGSGVLIESAISQIADPQQMADALLSVLNIERVMQSLNSQIQSDVATHLEANTQDIQGTANSLTQAINATVFLGNSAERLNLQFDDTAGGAIHYAWAMQEAVGGMDALNNKSASYYQNYFTQAEREAELREQISETMRELGLEMPKTRDGFRALVEAQSLNTDAGTANVAALLQLESAFAQLVPATQDATNAIDDNAAAQRSAADIAREKAQLERELLQAQGNTTALRQLELDALDESNRGIQEQIYAIKDAEQAEQERVRAQAERQRELDRQAQEAARAAEEAARAYQDAVSAAQQAVDQAKQQVQQAYQTFDQQSFDLQISYLGLVGDAEQALTMQRERELKAIDESLRPFQERLWALEDEAAAQEKAKQASRDYASELASIQTRLGSTFNSISQWIDQRNATSGTPNMNLGEAEDQFARQLELAKSGDRDALQGITEYADRYLKAGEEMYASGSGFQRIQEDVLKSLQDLPDQISAEEYLAKEITNKLGEVITSFDDMIKLSLANEIERAVFASQYTIGTLIDFAVGSNDLPDDLRTVLGNQAHRLDSTINYLIGTSELSEDDRALALNVSNNLVSTVDQLLGSELGWDDKRLALNTTNTLSSTVDLTLGADVSKETRQLALLNSNTLLATINAAQDDGITDETRALALNSANSIATDVNAVLGSNVSDAVKQLAISTSNNITSAVHAILTSDSSDAAMNLALNGTNTIRTFVRGLDHRLTDPDAKALALESSNYLTSTIRGVIDSRMPEAAKKLALKETNTLTTTIKAALADGKLTRDERRLIDARSESIVKRLQTGGNLNLTRDEWAVINAAGGTQRLNMLADVAFKDADLKHLDDVAKNTAEGGKSIAERAREQLESLNTLGEAMNGNVAALIGLDKSVLSLSGAINKLLNANENLLKLSMPDKPGGFGGSGRPTMPGAPDGSIADPNADPDTVAGGLGLMYQRFQSEWSRLSRNSQVANNTPDDIVNRAYRGVGGSVVAEMAQLIREIRTAGGDVSGGYIRDINPLHFFAQGGVFTNQVVSSPALFNMGLMGEAGPEAIMPLTRGSGGVLGVRAEIPPMPQLPLLDQNDVTQVLRDLVNENRMLNQRLEKIERHTGAAVQVQQAGFSRQINEQQRSNKALGDLASKARLEAAR